MTRGAESQPEQERTPDTDSDIVPADSSVPKFSMVAPSPEHATFRHEIGNELPAVRSALTLLRRELEAVFAYADIDQDKRENIEELLSIAEGGAGQAVRLIERDGVRDRAARFGGIDIVSLQDINISKILINKINYLRNILRRAIKIDSSKIEQGVLIAADDVLIMEILANIFQNALESMKCVPDRNNNMIVRLLVENRTCRIIIQDNGAGIHDEDGSHLFRRGFTTKKEGHGLGLVICRDLAQKMNGSFDLINGSEMGCGATAVLEFPVTGSDPPSRKDDCEQLPLRFGADPQNASK